MVLKSFDVVVCVYFLFVVLTWFSVQFPVVQFAQSCLTLFDPMDCSMPGFSVLYYLLEFAQTHVHRVSDAIRDPLRGPGAEVPGVCRLWEVSRSLDLDGPWKAKEAQ